MREHYTESDKARTRSIKLRLMELLLPPGASEGPWVDMDKVAQSEGARVGTCLSKMRELNDYHHVHLGLCFESRPLGGGRWEYRLVVRKPEQFTLPFQDAAHTSVG